MTALTMYLLIRTDLPMSPGKVAAQVGHGVQLAMRKAELPNWRATGGVNYAERLHEWEAYDYPKVILGATKRDFDKLCKLASEDVALANSMVRVVDLGRTEIPAGSFTCLGFVPMPKTEAKKWVGRLRLYQ